MVFSSTVFLFFFLPIVFLVYYNPFFKKRLFRNYVLLFFSLVFYAWGEPLFVFLMIFSIMFTWIMGILISKRIEKKKILIIGIVYHISVLFIFKYWSFVFNQMNVFFNFSRGGGNCPSNWDFLFFFSAYVLFVRCVLWKIYSTEKYTICRALCGFFSAVDCGAYCSL